MPVRCRLCTILIGEGYYHLEPHFLKIKGEDIPFCISCYEHMEPLSGWDRIREIAKEDYARLGGDSEEDTEEETNQETR